MKIQFKPYYILENGNEKRVDDVLKWAEWFEKSVMTRERIVKQTTLVNGYWVSTVFLGLDQSFGLSPKPQLYETMVFDRLSRDASVEMERYSTREQAEKGHGKYCMRYKYKKLWRIPIVVFLETLRKGGYHG